VRILAVFVTLLLAGALWLLLGSGDSSPEVAWAPNPAELERERFPHLTRGKEVLTLQAKTPSGEVPDGTEVGYRVGDGYRWRYADKQGRQTFTDAPIGTLEVMARAPGFADTKGTVVVIAGLAAERLLLLRRERDPAPEGPR
jgi:hypothetical protein